jgi:hypothetical protein
LSANAENGLRRTNDDKRKAVEIACKEFPAWADRKVAEMCQVSHPFVAKIRKSLNPEEKKQETPRYRAKSGNIATNSKGETSGNVTTSKAADPEDSPAPKLPSIRTSEPLQVAATQASDRPAVSQAVDVRDVAKFVDTLVKKHYGPLVRGLDEIKKMNGGSGDAFNAAMDAANELLEAITAMGQGVK